MDKPQLNQWIDKNKNEVLALGKDLFACPELGFCEFKTAEKITAYLDKLKLPYQKGLAITGIKATIGEGDGYHIGVVMDMDALPLKEGEGQIHSCGHSIQTAIGLFLAKVLMESNWVSELSGKVSFIFTPAEEFIDFEYRDQLIADGLISCRSGKQEMIANGVFDDIDCVLSAHANGDTGTLFDVNSTLAGFMAVKVIFLGQSAHSGAAPHLGRNTLHGATLCQNAIALLKDQFDPAAGVKINPVITFAGGTVNIIPEKTILETYIRANDIDSLYDAAKRTENCAIHCAKALGLEAVVENTPGYMPLKQNNAINKLIEGNMLLLTEPGNIVYNVISGASGDVGDLGYILPAVQFGFSGISGRFHSDNFKIIDEENCYVNTVKVMAGTIYDILSTKKNQVKNPDFNKRKEDYLKYWLFKN